MDLIHDEHTVGGLLFSLLLLLFVFWIAKRNQFFTLPPVSHFNPVTLLRAFGAFLTYLLFAFLILPIIYVLIAFLATGDVAGVKKLSQAWMGWLQLASLCVLFLLLLLYCFMIDTRARHYIFWGEGKRNATRFWQSVGMGVVGWLVSYPFVLFATALTALLSQWIWGESKVEQAAVKQLKLSMGNTPLYILMVLAIVFLVPFMEELLFRGFLQNLLKRYLSRSWAIGLTAIIFACAHFAPSQGIGNFQLILSLFVLSFFLGFIYERERALWASMALHMSFNGFSVLLITFT